MSEDSFLAGDDDLDTESEYVLNLYPLEERPFSRAWGRAIGFDPRYRHYFNREGIRTSSYRGWPPNVARIRKELDELPTSDAIFL